MSRMTLGALALASGAMLLSALGGGARASTVTYQLTACEGATYCGSTTDFGTVTVNLISSTSATITYNLTKGFIADPSDASVTFSMTGVSSWSVNSTDAPAGALWTQVTGGAQVDNEGFGADATGTGFGTFLQGEDCVSLTACGTNLVLAVTGTNLGLTTNSKGFFAAVDTCINSDSNLFACTLLGQFDSTGQGAVATSPTPLPGALPLFGTVLGASFLALSRRRSKHVLNRQA